MSAPARERTSLNTSITPVAAASQPKMTTVVITPSQPQSAVGGSVVSSAKFGTKSQLQVDHRISWLLSPSARPIEPWRRAALVIELLEFTGVPVDLVLKQWVLEAVAATTKAYDAWLVAHQALGSHLKSGAPVLEKGETLADFGSRILPYSTTLVALAAKEASLRQTFEDRRKQRVMLERSLLLGDFSEQTKALMRRLRELQRSGYITLRQMFREEPVVRCGDHYHCWDTRLPKPPEVKAEDETASATA
jgi:hypothetical protein